MQGFGAITTQGTGLETLKAYFELLHHPLPHKLPKDPSDWEDSAGYDAPHGLLRVWSNGRWRTTFSLASVVADIERIPGLTVSGE